MPTNFATGWPYLALLAIVLGLWFWERRSPEMVSRLEENIISALLAVITLVAFVQVVLRYGFNSGMQGALEFQRVMFAWLILFGMSYGVKIGSHLGVDSIIRLLPAGAFRVVALIGAGATLLYAVVLLNAAWLNLFGANLSTNWRQTGAVGYWTFMFDRGTGLDELKWPQFLQSVFGLQDRVQRWIAYLMLPVGLALLAFRSLQAFVAIWKGERDLVIAGHEAEDLVAAHKDDLSEKMKA
ncbi:MAG: TRAP transporter small permease [Rhodobiaceae bacterium]|nr:TRAP transporter small permease [Rhodobiaceae bacterium]MCC0050098.1 TRAP transporter small permease [Rhodobiaceae bacterium]